MKTEEINKLIEELFELDPVNIQAPSEVNAEMREGLAMAYAQKGFRDYLENATNKLVLNAVVKSDNWEGVLYRRGGIIFLKQLKHVCKDSYDNYLKLKKLANKDEKRNA